MEGTPLSCLCVEVTSGHPGLAVTETEGRPVHNSQPQARGLRTPPYNISLLCDPGQGIALSESHLGKGLWRFHEA